MTLRLPRNELRQGQREVPPPSYEEASRVKSIKPEEKLTLDEVMAQYQALDNIPPDLRRDLIRYIAGELESQLESAGGRYYENVSALYKSFIGDDDLIVRRENPRALMRLVAEEKDLQLEFDPAVGDEYENSVIWKARYGARGLQNAFLEGQGHVGGLVMVAGYRQSADLNVKEVTKEKRREVISIGGDKTDRTLVRATSGTIHPEDVAFVVIRYPALYYPEELMTESELERFDELMEDVEAGKRKDAGFIFRGFTFEPAEAEIAKAA